MSLRILEGERPGLAVLAFGTAPDAAELRLSFRSLSTSERLFLGPAGKWQKAPYFFCVVRGEDGRQFVVGPDVVNHLADQDRIEVASEGGDVREETIWENATPAFLPSEHTHTIHRELPPKPLDKKPLDNKPLDNKGPVTEIRDGARAETRPRDLGEGVGGDRATAAADTSLAENTEIGKPDRKRLLIAAAAVGAAILAAVVLVLAVPALRCAALGRDCPAPGDHGLREALACGMRVKETAPCEVAGCFAAYEAAVGPQGIAAEVTRLKGEAAALCARGGNEQKAADQARQCIARNRTQRQFCAIEPECVAPFRTAFPNAPALAELDAAAQQARAQCEADRAAASRARADEARKAQEARDAEEAKVFSDAQRCAAASPCVATACFDTYLRTYPSGTFHARVRDELAGAQARCAAARPRSTVGDGTYSARASAGCGVPAQSGIGVTISGGHISWQHDMALVPGGTPVPHQWDGTIDPAGAITAGVGGAQGYVATGRYDDTDREVEMRYPSCAAPITLSILGRRQ
ncbi:hypothetical protein [Xanthobacter sediminis]